MAAAPNVGRWRRTSRGSRTDVEADTGQHFLEHYGTRIRWTSVDAAATLARLTSTLGRQAGLLDDGEADLLLKYEGNDVVSPERLTTAGTLIVAPSV